MVYVTKRIVGPGFHQTVYDQVRQIPMGSVSTYGDIAKRLGSVKVARHVGWALAALNQSNDEDVPWHRVINARGQITSSRNAIQRVAQIEALQAEGIEISSFGTVNLKAHRWRSSE
jgi:methylated-DNA-protein-cysteine methyltransferase related protein